MNINPFIDLIVSILSLYSWIMITWIIMSLLISFEIINRHSRFIMVVYDALFRMTDPVLRRIRRYMPDLGMIDISPIVVFLGIQLITNILYTYLYTH